MSRYYLFVPKKTYDEFNPKLKELKADKSDNKINNKFKQATRDKFNKYSRVFGLTFFEDAYPKSKNDDETIMEVELDGRTLDLKEFTKQEITSVTVDGNIDYIALEHLKLNKDKDDGIISDFGIWHSPDESKYPTIYKKLDDKKAKWRWNELKIGSDPKEIGNGKLVNGK